MTSIKEWGSSGISLGLSLLAYEWLYVPLMRGWNLEPMSPTKMGLMALCGGTIVFMIGAWREAGQR